MLSYWKLPGKVVVREDGRIAVVGQGELFGGVFLRRGGMIFRAGNKIFLSEKAIFSGKEERRRGGNVV